MCITPGACFIDESKYTVLPEIFADINCREIREINQSTPKIISAILVYATVLLLSDREI